MKFNELQIDAKPNQKRVGRGIAAGQGKTAGRGTKGQKSRTGSGRRPGFEGGQNPLVQRLPKLRGFTSHRYKPEIIFIEQLSKLGATVTNQTLADAGLISNPYVSVKLVGNGQLQKKVSVKLQGASQGAQTALKKAGGSFEAVPRRARPKVEKEAKKTTKK